MEGVAAFLRIRALQVLEGVDGFDLGQIFLEPDDAGFGLAVFEFLDELGKVVLIKDGSAFEEGDFDFVVAG